MASGFAPLALALPLLPQSAERRLYIDVPRECMIDCKFNGPHRLVGLVVKASATRAENPEFESR